MTSNVLRFDFEEMARLAREAPEDFPRKREALIRQLINKAPQTVHLTEVHRSLDQICYQWVAQGLQLQVHLTSMAALSLVFMTACASELNRSAPAAESNASFRCDR